MSHWVSENKRSLVLCDVALSPQHCFLGGCHPFHPCVLRDAGTSPRLIWHCCSLKDITELVLTYVCPHCKLQLKTPAYKVTTTLVTLIWWIFWESIKQLLEKMLLTLSEPSFPRKLRALHSKNLIVWSFEFSTLAVRHAQEHKGTCCHCGNEKFQSQSSAPLLRKHERGCKRCCPWFCIFQAVFLEYMMAKVLFSWVHMWFGRPNSFLFEVYHS